MNKQNVQEINLGLNFLGIPKTEVDKKLKPLSFAILNSRFFLFPT